MENQTPELKRVVVTGARGSLGKVVSGIFQRAGLAVVGLDLSNREEGLVETDGGHYLGADLSDADQVRQALSTIESELGPIDALIHCAGGFRWAKIEDASDADLDFLLDANLRSSLYLVRSILGGMKERGFGRVVLISAKSTLGPDVGMGPYAATKAGLNALVQAVSREVAELDVTINAVMPSILDTAQNRADMPSANFDAWVSLEQLGEIIFALTQPLGAPINGALIPVSNRT